MTKKLFPEMGHATVYALYFAAPRELHFEQQKPARGKGLRHFMIINLNSK